MEVKAMDLIAGTLIFGVIFAIILIREEIEFRRMQAELDDWR